MPGFQHPALTAQPLGGDGLPLGGRGRNYGHHPRQARRSHCCEMRRRFSRTSKKTRALETTPPQMRQPRAGAVDPERSTTMTAANPASSRSRDSVKGELHCGISPHPSVPAAVFGGVFLMRRGISPLRNLLFQVGTSSPQNCCKLQRFSSERRPLAC